MLKLWTSKLSFCHSYLIWWFFFFFFGINLLIFTTSTPPLFDPSLFICSLRSYGSGFIYCLFSIFEILFAYWTAANVISKQGSWNSNVAFLPLFKFAIFMIMRLHHWMFVNIMWSCDPTTWLRYVQWDHWVWRAVLQNIILHFWEDTTHRHSFGHQNYM